MSEPLEMDLGRQRIAQLRALIAETKPGHVMLPTMYIPVQGGFNEPYVLVGGRELAAMLDRLEAATPSEGTPGK